jgi:hypothetical protein
LEKKSDAAAKKKKEIETLQKDLTKVVSAITEEMKRALQDLENSENEISKIAEGSIQISENLKQFVLKSSRFRESISAMRIAPPKGDAREALALSDPWHKLREWKSYSFRNEWDKITDTTECALNVFEAVVRKIKDLITNILENIFDKTGALKKSKADYRASFKESEQTMVKKAAYAYVFLDAAFSVYKTLNPPQFISSDLFINLVRFAARPEQLISLNARGLSVGIFDWTATVPNLTWRMVILWAMNPWELRDHRMVLEQTRDTKHLDQHISGDDEGSTDGDTDTSSVDSEIPHSLDESQQSSLGPESVNSLDEEDLRKLFERASTKLDPANAKNMVCFLHHAPLDIIQKNLRLIIEWIANGAAEEKMKGLEVRKHTPCTTWIEMFGQLMSHFGNLFCPTDLSDCDLSS